MQAFINSVMRVELSEKEDEYESSFHPIQGGYDIPMRVVGANIPYEWLIYILMLIPLGIFYIWSL